MDLVIPPGEKRMVMPGVTVTRSPVGTMLVQDQNHYVGWLCASWGRQWHAYLATTSPLGTYLGRFTQYDAVNAIVAAAQEAA